MVCNIQRRPTTGQGPVGWCWIIMKMEDTCHPMCNDAWTDITHTITTCTLDIKLLCVCIIPILPLGLTIICQKRMYY